MGVMEHLVLRKRLGMPPSVDAKRSLGSQITARWSPRITDAHGSPLAIQGTKVSLTALLKHELMPSRTARMVASTTAAVLNKSVPVMPRKTEMVKIVNTDVAPLN